MEIRPAGRRALIADVEDAESALALASWARAARVGAEEIVPAARTVLLDGLDDVEHARALLARWEPSSEVPAGELVEIPVHYDGADLDAVAERWRTDRGGVVARHTSTEFLSAFCGFAPGFAYLSGLPADLAVPRLDTPRSRVPAGSVGLAGPWCGIYPTASPGGWLLIGRTEVTLWNPTRPHPALLSPGTRVRFRDASSAGNSGPGPVAT